MRISVFFCFLIAMGAGAIAGCLSNSSQESTLTLSEIEQKSIQNFRAELEIGRNMAGRLLNVYTPIQNEEVVSYVNELGSYLASFSNSPERKYMFQVVQDTSINAFACPGGYIVVTTGAIQNAKSEAELAMVLAHEIAHVDHEHMMQTLQKKNKSFSNKKEKKEKKFGPEIQARKRPEAPRSEVGSFIAKQLVTQGASFNLLNAVNMGLTVITEEGIDPKLEFEADLEGTKYAIKAGYEPYALYRYLERLGAKGNQTKQLSKTHPKFSARTQNLKILLDDIEAKNIAGAFGSDRFRKISAQLNRIKK